MTKFQGKIGPTWDTGIAETEKVMTREVLFDN